MISFLIFAYFYAAWFGVIFFAKSDYAWGPLVLPLGLVLLLMWQKLIDRKLFLLGLGVTAFGILFDSLMAHFGLITVHGKTGGPLGFFIPSWLIAIWLLFTYSMIGMRAKLSFPYGVAAALGAISGPLSYKSGAYFEVLHMTSTASLITYSVFWGLTFPAFLFLLRRCS